MNGALDYFGTDESVGLLDTALQEGSPRPDRLAAQLAWYLRERDPPRAERLAEPLAVHDAPPTSATWEAAVATLTLGHVALLANRLDRARRFAESALRLYRELADPIGMGDVAMLLAGLDEAEGEVELRKAHWSDAAVGYREARNDLRPCLVDLERARITAMTDAASAQALLDASEHLPAWRENPVVVARLERVAGNMAATQAQSGRSEFRIAAEHFGRAHRLSLAAGNPLHAALSAVNAARALQHLNDVAGALAWAEEALGLTGSRGMLRARSIALLVAADAMHALKRWDEAMQFAAEARDILSSAPSSRVWAIACEFYGKIALELDRCEEAAAALDEALDVAQRIGDELLAGGMHSERALALSRLGRADAAREAAAASLAACGSTDQPDWRRALGCYAHADIARRHGMPLPAGSAHATAAIHYMEAALTEASRLPEYEKQAQWLVELSHDYEAAGDFTRALDYQRRAGQASARLQEKKADELAAALKIKHETERAKAEAAHQKALAEAEARRAEAEARANRAKGTFLANMSHELRSPLNAMLGFTRLLLRDPTVTERKEELGIVLRSGEHLHNLINQVLEMSKIEAGRVTLVEADFELEALLHEVQTLFRGAAAQKGLALCAVCSPSAPRWLRADGGKLRQVLINLVGNAIKFTSQGSVDVQASVSGTNGSMQLGIVVQDTGVGIAKEELAALGHVFVQAQAGQRAAEGTGLGLAISRGFVELMGGRLELSSDVGMGTRATVQLPVHIAAAPTGGTQPHAPPRRIVGLAPRTPAPRILVADDRDEARLLLRRLLEPLGFQVREAATGTQAVAQWEQWQPQLILMDMRMPEMDGREATRRIKRHAKGPDTVVLALTASSFEEQRQEILAAGCDDFIRKPFDDEALLHTMGRYLGLDYAYEHLEPAPGAAALPSEDDGVPVLPAALRDRMRDALNRLDVDAIESLLVEIEAAHPAAAAALRPDIARFQYAKAAERLQ